ncbi:MAG: YihY/virulence factor BrkB family protein [Verrucomicrobia bacterium]|nr:YihY/virulence factor BrkB family protein [Verrucomicrobiota bacterium]
MPSTPTTRPPRGGLGKLIYLFAHASRKWNEDKCAQLGAALAYYTVFSLAPLVLVLLAGFGMVFGSSEVARQKIIEQLRYLVDPSAVKVIEQIAANVAQPHASGSAAVIGILVALFGASGVFGQLQDALNTIWGVKPKPGQGLWFFVRNRFLSFAMVAGVGFLLLVSLALEGVLRGFSGLLKTALPGGDLLALGMFVVFDLALVVLLFAMIFRFLPDVHLKWRDVGVGAGLTAVLFYIGKFLLGIYLGSGAAGSAYGAAGSLITLLLWVFYSAQILLFGAEFTQVYATAYGSHIRPVGSAIRVERREVEIDTPNRRE